MKISCNILKKHIKNSENIDFVSIWDKFSIRTAEVEGIELKGNDFDGVITAKIVECNPHPESEKLHILKVDNGQEIIQVVCGAPNVHVGLIGALVLVGGRIGEIEIGIRPLIGVDSHGMMCSGRELGISDNHDGIIELPADTPLGLDIKTILPINDIIVEIDNKSLSNRPDLWGHYGIAREIAAISGRELLPLELSDIASSQAKLDIKINNPDLCYRYMGTKINSINNNVSPMWMQVSLYYVGMRSINLIVDVTNYVMLELGQPMHAFDARKVSSIEIGLANEGDKFKTLDDIERTLTKDNLMIKNGGEYFAMAGVMGGLDSEILPDTIDIILESATFEATSVRRTAAAHGLRTEASARYEKSLDPNLAADATLRFIKLIQLENPNLELGSAITDVYPKVLKEKIVTLEKTLLYKYMGFKIADEDVKAILESLMFKVTVNKDHFKVVTPTFRATKDVTIGVDLIEEIARMYGYENFNHEPLKIDMVFSKQEPVFDDEYTVKSLLAISHHLNEVHTYLWHPTSFLKTLGISLDNVKLTAKTEDNILRTDLALSLLEVAETNLKNYPEFGVFEIGTVIQDNENKRQLSVLLVRDNDNLKAGYYEIKAIANSIFKLLKNIKVDFIFSEASDYYHPELTQDIIVNNRVLGQIKVFTRNISNKISKKKSFIALTIDFDLYNELDIALPLISEVSKYPTTKLDYTLLVKRGIYYQEIDNILNKFTSPIIKNRQLVDIYLEDEVKKVTIRYTVGSNEKTLTSEELEDFKQAFIKFLQANEINIMQE